jgi:hypothetical protein
MDAFHQLIDAIPPVAAGATGAWVYERFQNEPDTMAIAVVDEDQRPIGMVERNAFFLKMAAEYGRALYARRPVTALMETSFLMVDHLSATEDFCRRALDEQASDLMRGFIVVCEGRYLGVGTALSLLKVQRRPPSTARRRWPAPPPALPSPRPKPRPRRERRASSWLS